MTYINPSAGRVRGHEPGAEDPRAKADPLATSAPRARGDPRARTAGHPLLEPTRVRDAGVLSRVRVLRAV